MNELTPQQIVAWFRAEAKKYSDMADELERKFGFPAQAQPVVRFPRKSPQPVVSSGVAEQAATVPAQALLPGSVTAADLEARIKYRSGRIDDLARHFNVSSEQIKALLEPNSRVYVAERGWLKLREQGS